MLDLTKHIRDQFHAALDMLELCLKRCPEALWSDPQDKNPVWRVIYHVLFYTDLYTQPTLQDFAAWPTHIADLEDLGKPASLPDGQPMPPLAPAQLADYMAHCRQQIDQHTAQLIPDAASGFDWIPLNKLELQLYNIRHIQHHTGELAERLWVRAGIEIDWIGRPR